MAPRTSAAKVDERLAEIAQIFGTIGEIMTNIPTAKREDVDESQSRIRLVNASKTFLRELDVSAAREFLGEIDSTIIRNPVTQVASGTTITVTVTVTVTVTRPEEQLERIGQ